MNTKRLGIRLTWLPAITLGLLCVFEGITVYTVGTQIHVRRGQGGRGNDDAN